MSVSVLDTSKKAKRVLGEFLAALERIQEEITDTDGASFGCFPFQFDWKNQSCQGMGKMSPDSPVCVLCRELHGYDGTSQTWPKRESE